MIDHNGSNWRGGGQVVPSSIVAGMSTPTVLTIVRGGASFSLFEDGVYKLTLSGYTGPRLGNFAVRNCDMNLIGFRMFPGLFRRNP